MNVVDEIKERLDIVDFVSRHVQLQKTGRNYKGLCPFHSERTPSFVVFPETQTWHCFGACNEGGDIFSFVMKKEGWDFRTALEELAQQAGVTLRPRTPERAAEQEQYQRLRELLVEATTYFHNLLLKAPQAESARAYVAQRGLNSETVERFQLGYSLDDWHALERYLESRGYERAEMVQAGLLVEREEDGRTYDRFRGRLMIPIRDSRGRVVGFGARTLDPEGVPKYINSPQTPLFDKSRLLFGFSFARPAIRAMETAVIVEGYMDVMQAHQAGFTNVVAQMGTALTEEHLRQLHRYARRIILALDPDAAGSRATLRGLDVAREALSDAWEPVFDPRGLLRYESRLGTDLRVLTLPRGWDPDDLIRDDPDRWAALVEEAVPLVDYYFAAVLEGRELEDPAEKSRAAQALLPIIHEIADPVQRDHYLQKLARLLRVDERTLLAQWRGRRSRRAPARRPAQQPVSEPGASRRRLDLESYCLARLVTHPALLADVDAALVQAGLDPLLPGDFEESHNRALFQALRRALEEREPDTVPVWLESTLEPWLLEHLQSLQTLDTDPLLLSEPRWLREARALPESGEVSEEKLREDLVTSVLRLRERHLRQRSQELRFLIQELQEEPGSDLEMPRRTMRAYTQTLQRLQRALALRSPEGRWRVMSGQV